MKINKIAVIFPVVLIIISFFIAIYFYPVFPDQVATHWGIDNQVNGYSSKALGLFFMPVLSVFLFFLFISLPKIDPYKKNFDQFKNYFQNFINIVFAFLFYVYLLTIIWNLDFHFNMIQILSPGFAILFYYAGVLTSNAKRNWFVGIRTPWTMSSELVWDKTHQIGGELFKLTGLISLLSLLFPNLAIFFILMPIVFTTAFIFVYSYLEYKKIN
ncbi:MAG: SdpI family protein [Candidatus Shapirobacteria bacterium]|jgi:uncharacterized membrane protein